MRRKYVSPETRLSLFITSQEHAMMLDAVLPVSPDLERRLCAGVAGPNGIELYLTLDEIDELYGCIAAEANHCKNKSKRKRWNALSQKFKHILETYTDEEDPHDEQNVFSILSPDLSEQLQTLLANNQFGSLDEVNNAIRKIVNKHNQKPKEDFGGLSSEQVAYLIYSDWDDPQGFIQFNQELPSPFLNDARYLRNTQVFLLALVEEETVKTTAAGNLPRKFITRLLEQCLFPPGYLDNIHRYNKVLNEKDVFPLHRVRILCELAGLIKKQKGAYSITIKGSTLLPDSKAAALYFLLFKTHYRQFNIAYLDGMPENQALQDTIAYSLYRTKKHFKDWRKSEGCASSILLPAAHEEALSHGFKGSPDFQVNNRILKPLEEFGLLQRREQHSNDKNIPQYEYKRTQLFEQFVQFNL